MTCSNFLCPCLIALLLTCSITRWWLRKQWFCAFLWYLSFMFRCFLLFKGHSKRPCAQVKFPLVEQTVMSLNKQNIDSIRNIRSCWLVKDGCADFNRMYTSQCFKENIRTTICVEKWPLYTAKQVRIWRQWNTQKTMPILPMITTTGKNLFSQWTKWKLHIKHLGNRRKQCVTSILVSHSTKWSTHVIFLPNSHNPRFFCTAKNVFQTWIYLMIEFWTL